MGCLDALYVLQDYQRLLSTQPPRRLNTAKLAESSALKVGAGTPHTGCPPLPHMQHAGGLRRAQSQMSHASIGPLLSQSAFMCSLQHKLVELHVRMQSQPASCLLLHLQSLAAVLHLLPPASCLKDGEAAAV